jgi:hypothetical protein
MTLKMKAKAPDVIVVNTPVRGRVLCAVNGLGASCAKHTEEARKSASTSTDRFMISP